MPNSLEARVDSRLHYRIVLTGFVPLLLPHARKRIWTYALNMSMTGLLVRSWSPVKVGAEIIVQPGTIPLLVGTARVRHCARKGLTYRIALEFCSPIFERF
jgi:hypothetical protein